MKEQLRKEFRQYCKDWPEMDALGSADFWIEKMSQSLSQQKEGIVNEAHNLVSGLHVKARKSYASDSWDAGYHDALFAVEKLLLTLIKNQ